MTNDRPQERVEKQQDRETQEMRFDALDLMKEGVPKGDKTADASSAEYAAMLRSPESMAKAEEKREADFQTAMQALDRGDEGPARKLIKGNDKEIALTKQVIAKITGEAEQQSMRAWSS